MAFKQHDPSCPGCCGCPSKICVTVTEFCHGGIPVADATVVFRDASNTIVHTGTTDAAGVYCMAPSMDAMFTVTASKGTCQSASTVVNGRCAQDTPVAIKLYCQPFPPDTITVTCCGYKVPGASVTCVQNGVTIFSGSTDSNGVVNFTRQSTLPVTVTITEEYCQTLTRTLSYFSICGPAGFNIDLAIKPAYVCCAATGRNNRVWPQGITPVSLFLSDNLQTVPINFNCSAVAVTAGDAEHVNDAIVSECLGRVYCGNSDNFVCLFCSQGALGESGTGYGYGSAWKVERETRNGTTSVTYALSLAGNLDGTYTATMTASWRKASQQISDFNWGTSWCFNYKDPNPAFPSGWQCSNTLNCACPCQDYEIVYDAVFEVNGTVCTPINAPDQNPSTVSWYAPASASVARATKVKILPASAITPDSLTLSFDLDKADSMNGPFVECPAANVVWAFEGPHVFPGGIPTINQCIVPPPPGGTTVVVTS